MLRLDQAVLVGVIWGLVIVAFMSDFLARMQQTATWRVDGAHVTIALVVIASSRYVGVLVRSMAL